jgi:hypothetical protein
MFSCQTKHYYVSEPSCTLYTIIHIIEQQSKPDHQTRSSIPPTIVGFKAGRIVRPKLRPFCIYSEDTAMLQRRKEPQESLAVEQITCAVELQCTPGELGEEALWEVIHSIGALNVVGGERGCLTQ